MGVYLYSSCEMVASNQPILESRTVNGTVTFSNVNFGFSYTAVVHKSHLKLGCIQIDLTTHANL
jgi:hypothetical protein